MGSLWSVLLLGSTLGCWSRAPGPAPLALAEAPVLTFEERVPANAVDLVLAVRAGSAHDPVGREGLAWLTAQAVARGSDGVGAALYDLGAHVEVAVGPEVVTYHLRCRTDDAVPCATLLGQALISPDLGPDVTEEVRAQASARLVEPAGGDARALADRIFDRWTYEGHPYGHPAQGLLSVLPTLSSADLRAFHADRYVRPAAALGIAGQPTAEAVVDVQAALAGLPPRLYADVTPRRLPQLSGHHFLIVGAPVAETWIVLGQALDLAPDHPDRLAVEAGLAALGDGRDSRLGLALRQRAVLGPADELMPQVAAGLDAADLRVQPALRLELRTAPGQGLAATQAALTALEQMAQTGPTDDELRLWQSAATGLAQAGQATPLDRARAAAVAHLVGAPPPSQRVAAIAALTPQAVAQALRRWVHPDDLRVVIVTATPSEFDSLQPSQPQPDPDAPEALSTSSVEGSDAPQAAGYGVQVAGVTRLTAQELLR